MNINWNAVSANQAKPIIDPRDIYSSLTHRRWQRLRPEQNEVLSFWYERRNQSDLVIKQNTGSGKTLSGLLIAQSGLNEKIGPSIYLVPDNFLANQVISEARDAKIKVTTDSNDLDFRASKAILVTNFYKLLNGHSSLAKMALGTIVVDDAHSAIAEADNLFSVSIPSTCIAFSQLLNLFDSDLKHQSPKAYSEIVDGDFSKPIRIPPRSVKEHDEEIFNIVNPYTKNSDFPSIFFPWPYIANHLKLSIVTVSTNSIEIKTPCPNIQLINSFVTAQRRVYLTATLEDAGELVTELDANPDTVQKVIVPRRASDLGDRIILAPQLINPKLDESSIHKLARSYADGDRDLDGIVDSKPINVVVLVPSNKKAQEWQADQVLDAQNMTQVIDNMKKRKHEGIVVLINKYDGVDLPDDACRLLIIDGVPTARKPSDQREQSALTRSLAFKSRYVQKLEQGMGRGTRQIGDYCAVLLLNSEAALTIEDEQQLQFYSPATQAQIKLSSQLAQQIKGRGLSSIAELINMFLNRDENWISLSLHNTATVEYNPVGRVSKLEIARRRAFDYAIMNNFDDAVKILRKAVDGIQDEISRGWYMEELSEYLEFVNPTEAQKCLITAKAKNHEVIMPAIKPTFHKLSTPKIQGQGVLNYLKVYKEPELLQLRISDMFSKVAWAVPQTADSAEEAIKQIGEIIGFKSSRPEKELEDGGPDVLWAMSPQKFAVIELKTEVSRADKVITKGEAAQLTHSADTWFSDKYSGNSAIPVLIHPYTELDKRAHVPKGTRIITPDDLNRLKADVTNFISVVTSNPSTLATNDINTIANELRVYHLTAEQVIQFHSHSSR